MGEGGLGEGEGVGGGGGGRGHFIHLATYCTTTWCFALKGLRTTRDRDSACVCVLLDAICAVPLDKSLGLPLDTVQCLFLVMLKARSQ